MGLPRCVPPSSSKSYTALQLRSLMYTTKWKQRYDDFLKKIIYPGQVIDQNLNDWFNKFKGRHCPKIDALLFTSDTMKVVNEQCKKAKHLVDVLPVETMYNEEKATKRMKHGLSFKRSCRGESHVESAQGQQQHYGNGGMNKDRANEFILRGHAQANTKKREKLEWNKGDGEWRDKTLSWLHGVPIFYDHLRMAKINGDAADVIEGWTPFDRVFIVKDDNGERFLAEYCDEQKGRDTKYSAVGKDRLTDRCPCLKCAQAIEPLPHRRRAGVAVQDAALGLDDDFMMSMEDEGETDWPGSQEQDWPHQSNDDLLNDSMIENEEDPMGFSQTINESEHGGLTPPDMPFCQPVSVDETQKASTKPVHHVHNPFPRSPFPSLVPPGPMTPMGMGMGMGMAPMPMTSMGMGPMGMMMQMQHMQMQQMERMQQMMQRSPPRRRRKRNVHIDSCCELYVRDRTEKKNGRPRHSLTCPNR